MSKRAGTVISLDDLIDALGVDAARYALIRYSVDTTLDLDLDLWTRQTSDNPVFYVQYAHARLASLARNAADLGIDLGDGYDAALLDTERESELIALLAAYPQVLTAAADLREPHRVARYLEDLASGYHKFYDSVRVLPMGDEDATPATVARLWLCRGDPAGAGERPCRAGRLGPGTNVTGDDEPIRPVPGTANCWRCTRQVHRRPTSTSCIRRSGRAAPPAAGRRASGWPGSTSAIWPTEYGTPLMVIDEADFRSRCQDFADAFGQAARRALRRQGLPVRRGGALAGPSEGLCAGRVHRRRTGAGAARRLPRGPDHPARLQQVAPPSCTRAVDAGVGAIVVDSFHEIARLAEITERRPGTVAVMVRVTVGVEAHTHEFIATAHEDQKFGFSLAGGHAAEAVRRVVACPGLALVGLHSHIGSQIFDPSGFEVSAHRVVRLLAEIVAEYPRSRRRRVTTLDLGGGLGIAYVPVRRSAAGRRDGQVADRDRAPRGAGRGPAGAADRRRAGPRHRRARNRDRSTRSAPSRTSSWTAGWSAGTSRWTAA